MTVSELTAVTASSRQLFAPQDDHVTQRDYDLLYSIPEHDIIHHPNEFKVKPPSLTGLCRPQYNYYATGSIGALNSKGLPASIPLYEIQPVLMVEGTPQWKLAREVFAAECPPDWDEQTITDHFLKLLKNGVCYTDHTDPTAWKQITTHSNVYYPTGKTMWRGDIKWWEILQLKADTYAKMKDRLERYPHLENDAVTSNIYFNQQGRGRFPQAGGRRVKVLQFCRTETNWISGNRVRMLSRYERIPDVYFP